LARNWSAASHSRFSSAPVAASFSDGAIHCTSYRPPARQSAPGGRSIAIRYPDGYRWIKGFRMFSRQGRGGRQVFGGRALTTDAYAQRRGRSRI
jgi:hypothetical protein